MRQYDKAGFDRNGFNRFGRDVTGYDRDGFRADGLNRNGETRSEALRPEIVRTVQEDNGDTTTVYRCHWRGEGYREFIRRDGRGREVFAGNTSGLKMWTTYSADGSAEYHDTEPK